MPHQVRRSRKLRALQRRPRFEHLSVKPAHGPDTIPSHEETGNSLTQYIRRLTDEEPILRAQGRIADAIFSTNCAIYQGCGSDLNGHYERYILKDAVQASNYDGTRIPEVRPCTVFLLKYANSNYPRNWQTPTFATPLESTGTDLATVYPEGFEYMTNAALRQAAARLTEEIFGAESSDDEDMPELSPGKSRYMLSNYSNKSI